MLFNDAVMVIAKIVYDVSDRQMTKCGALLG
jgi:hypothetical protein